MAETEREEEQVQVCTGTHCFPELMPCGSCAWEYPSVLRQEAEDRVKKFAALARARGQEQERK